MSAAIAICQRCKAPVDLDDSRWKLLYRGQGDFSNRIPHHRHKDGRQVSYHEAVELVEAESQFVVP
jgi:hypothetical protein